MRSIFMAFGLSPRLRREVEFQQQVTAALRQGDMPRAQTLLAQRRSANPLSQPMPEVRGQVLNFNSRAQGNTANPSAPASQPNQHPTLQHAAKLTDGLFVQPPAPEPGQNQTPVATLEDPALRQQALTMLAVKAEMAKLDIPKDSSQPPSGFDPHPELRGLNDFERKLVEKGYTREMAIEIESLIDQHEDGGHKHLHREHLANFFSSKLKGAHGPASAAEHFDAAMKGMESAAKRTEAGPASFGASPSPSGTSPKPAGPTGFA
jgi:hypothetical protein